MYVTKYVLEHKLPSGQKILVNTLTGVILDVDDLLLKEFQNLRDGEDQKVSEAAIALFESKGFLYSSEQREAELIGDYLIRSQQANKNKPLVFGFCMTYSCNLRCRYCYEEGIHRDRQVMNPEQIDATLLAIQKIQKEKGSQSSRIVLEGGEPLLETNRDAVEYFFQKVSTHIHQEREQGNECELMVFSNGENTLSYVDLLETNKEMISSVLITLAGPQDLHNRYRHSLAGRNNYQDVIETIDTLLQRGVPTMVVLNLDKGNLHSLPQIQEIIQEKNWLSDPNYRGCYVSRIKYFVEGQEEKGLSEYEFIHEVVHMVEQKLIQLEIFNFGDLRLLKNVIRFCNSQEVDQKRVDFHQFQSCAADRAQQYLFGPRGFIYGCTKVTGREEYAIGTYEGGVEWEKERYRWWTERDVLTIPQCRGCNMAFLCGGGCAYEAEEKNGSAYERPVCTDVENLLKVFLDSRERGIDLLHQDFVYENNHQR